jgi:glycosyltransferase involved in cell wall biosynthesis
LAAALLLLLENGDVWRRYSAAGRKRVVEQFDLAQQTGRLETIFEQLLAGQ